MLAPYREGMKAAEVGKAVWENPYAKPYCVTKHSQDWFFGWCYGMQLKAAEAAK